MLDVLRGSGELCRLVIWGVEGPDALAWLAARRSSHMVRRSRSWGLGLSIDEERAPRDHDRLMAWGDGLNARLSLMLDGWQLYDVMGIQATCAVPISGAAASCTE